MLASVLPHMVAILILRISCLNAVPTLLPNYSLIGQQRIDQPLTEQGREQGWTSSQSGAGREREEVRIQPQGRGSRRHKKTAGTKKAIKFKYLGDFGWEVVRLIYSIKID